MKENKNSSKDSNDMVTALMIGIISAVVALGCKVLVDYQDDPLSATAKMAWSFMLVMTINAAIFLVGGLMMVVTYSSWQAALKIFRNFCKPTRAFVNETISIAGLAVIFGAIGLINLNGITSWWTIFTGSLATFLLCLCAGVHRAIEDLNKEEKAYQNQRANPL